MEMEKLPQNLYPHPSNSEGMVKTMNLGSVIAGDFQSIDVNETVPMLRDADNIMIIPGYGMAVAQAQHTINEITQ